MAERNPFEVDEIDALLGEDPNRRRPTTAGAPVDTGITARPPQPRVDVTAPHATTPGVAGPAVSDPTSLPMMERSGIFAQPPTSPTPPPLTAPQNSPERTQFDTPEEAKGRTAITALLGTPSTGAQAQPRASGDTSRPSGTGSNPNDAYNDFTSRVDPNASQGEMESAIEASFGHLPGYGGAYKESVMLNGVWYDLVGGYGGPNASFHGLMPKTGGKGKLGALGMTSELGGLPGLTDESTLPAIMAAIDAAARGKESPLVKQELDTLLAEMSPAIAAQIAPMVQQPSRGRARRPPPVPEGGV